MNKGRGVQPECAARKWTMERDDQLHYLRHQLMLDWPAIAAAMQLSPDAVKVRAYMLGIRMAVDRRGRPRKETD